MIDKLVNWFLDLVDAGLAQWPAWTPAFPDLTPLANPLAQINYLVALDLPWGIALAMLLLGPGLVFVTVLLWVVGLFTPSSTKPA